MRHLDSGKDNRGAPRYLWFVSYPDGAARKITNDLHDYDGVSVTADGKTIAAVQTQEALSISVTSRSDGDKGGATISSGSEILAEVGSARERVSWTPDNRIVYSSRAGGNWDLWTMNADGSGQKQLTFDSHNDLYPSVSSDGRYIFFASDRTAASTSGVCNRMGATRRN